MNLQLAHINYGRGMYPVKPSDTLPLPTTFDFTNAEECARKVFAVMSNASGGFTLRDCKVRIDPEGRCANLTASGCHVFYNDETQPKLTIDQAVDRHLRSTIINLGDVSTDQYGNGWQRAKWF